MLKPANFIASGRAGGGDNILALVQAARRTAGVGVGGGAHRIHRTHSHTAKPGDQSAASRAALPHLSPVDCCSCKDLPVGTITTLATPVIFKGVPPACVSCTAPSSKLQWWSRHSPSHRHPPIATHTHTHQVGAELGLTPWDCQYALFLYVCISSLLSLYRPT